MKTASLIVSVVLIFCALPCSADVIAHWRFEPDDPGTPQNEFLLDSSGNHHSLTNNGVHSIPDIANVSGGDGSAGFDGYSFLNTVDTLDLRPLSDLATELATTGDRPRNGNDLGAFSQLHK